VFDVDAGEAYVACLAGFAKGVVAAVRVFALLALSLNKTMLAKGGIRLKVLEGKCIP
jgi:hypothetical protein